MKLLITLTLIVLGSIVLSAQNVAGVDISEGVIYCEVIPVDLGLRKGFGVVVDYGQPQNKNIFKMVDRASLMNNNGEQLLFDTHMEVLNYFADKWRMVQRYTRKDGTNSNVTYLMERLNN